MPTKHFLPWVRLEHVCLPAGAFTTSIFHESMNKFGNTKQKSAKPLKQAVELADTWHGKMNGRLGVHMAAHAPDTCSRDLLERVRDAASEMGLGVNCHLAQSEIEVERIQERDGMTPSELLDEIGLLNDRLIAAHCLFLNDEDIERVGKARINVAHIPKGNATGGTAAQTSKLRRAGAQITLATDNMHADIVEVMRWGVKYRSPSGSLRFGFWQPETVFEMATIGGARAMGLERKLALLRSERRLTW